MDARPARTLNGWERLWVIASALWICYPGWLLFKLVREYSLTDGGFPEAFSILLAMMVLPPAFLYGAGMVVAWVVRGFQPKGP